MRGAYRPLGQAARKSALAALAAQTVLPLRPPSQAAGGTGPYRLKRLAKRELDSQTLGLHHSTPFYRKINGQAGNQN
jgi:hypothetical protein